MRHSPQRSIRPALGVTAANLVPASPAASPAHCSSRGSGRGTSPKPPREPRGASVDAALPADEFTQRPALVGRRVPHHTGPLAPGPFVGLGRVGGAADDGCERVFPIRDFQPLQAQRRASSAGLPAFSRPPGRTRHRGRRRSRCGRGWIGIRRRLYRDREQNPNGSRPAAARAGDRSRDGERFPRPRCDYNEFRSPRVGFQLG